MSALTPALLETRAPSASRPDTPSVTANGSLPLATEEAVQSAVAPVASVVGQLSKVAPENTRLESAASPVLAR